MSGDSVREFRFPPDAAHVRLLRQAAREAAADMGRESLADSLALVLDELANNAIEHGASYREEHADLRVRLQPRSNGVMVDFEDREMPRAVVAELGEALASGSLPVADSERGRGLFLIAIHFSDVRVTVGPHGGFLFRGLLAARDA